MRVLPRRLRALGCVSLTATLLAGCSADQISATSATTTRMTRPTVIPEVEDDATASDPPQANEDSSLTNPNEPTPEQIWVRSAEYANKTYTLKIATASGGTFDLVDARAVGGTLANQGENHPCTTAHEERLTSRIAGAITNVTHLVTVTCPVPARLTMPAIDGSWAHGNAFGSTSAIFALGGASAQGKPRPDADPGSLPAPSQEPVDVTVVSLEHHGKRATLRAWTTEYVGLTISPPPSSTSSNDTTYDDPRCTTKPLSQTRPGVKNHTRQRLFEVTCSALAKLEGASLEVDRPSGILGQDVSTFTESAPLKTGPIDLG